MEKENFAENSKKLSKEQIIKAEEKLGEVAVKTEKAEIDDMKENLDKLGSKQNDASLSATTFFLGNKNEFWEDMQRNGVKPRRFFFYTNLASLIALGGNLLGITSALFGIWPNLPKKYRLDILYDVQGYKRYFDAEMGFEFVYPKDWVADRAILLAEQNERMKKLEMPSVEELMKAKSDKLRPIVAFGPIGMKGPETAKENVSVVKSTLEPGFSLRGTLGEPFAAAEKLLTEAIAPKGSNREATLISAESQNKKIGEIYEFEYTLNANRINVRNICVIASRKDELFTLTVVTPQSKWAECEKRARDIAESFEILPK